MNEFSESMEMKKCAVQVVRDGKAEECGKPTFLELCNYTEPIPMCKGHINKLRTRAQRKWEKQRT